MFKFIVLLNTMGYTTWFYGCFRLDKRLKQSIVTKLETSKECGDWMYDSNENSIKWKGNEKFHHYNHCLSFLITTFIEPNNYKLNGKISYQGEEKSDYGIIKVVDNKMMIAIGKKEDETKSSVKNKNKISNNDGTSDNLGYVDYDISKDRSLMQLYDDIEFVSEEENEK